MMPRLLGQRPRGSVLISQTAAAEKGPLRLRRHSGLADAPQAELSGVGCKLDDLAYRQRRGTSVSGPESGFRAARLHMELQPGRHFRAGGNPESGEALLD